MPNTAEKIIHFYKHLSFAGDLPEGISVLDPMKEDIQVKNIVKQFFRKYYNDSEKRTALIGINPGRFGGGLTGIPFTDPKRLFSECGIAYMGKLTHEPSSVFMYEMIRAFGGPAAFYKKFYFSSVSPLGFIKTTDAGKELNYNYYDLPALEKAVKPFAMACLEKQFPFLNRNYCIGIGTGKNEKFIRRLNGEKKYFQQIEFVEHPRYIMQYKSKDRERYIAKYLEALSKAGNFS